MTELILYFIFLNRWATLSRAVTERIAKGATIVVVEAKAIFHGLEMVVSLVKMNRAIRTTLPQEVVGISDRAEVTGRQTKRQCLVVVKQQEEEAPHGSAATPHGAQVVISAITVEKRMTSTSATMSRGAKMMMMTAAACRESFVWSLFSLCTVRAIAV